MDLYTFCYKTKIKVAKLLAKIADEILQIAEYLLRK